MGNCRQSEQWEYMRETILQTPKAMKKKVEEVLQVPEWRFPGTLPVTMIKVTAGFPAAHGD